MIYELLRLERGASRRAWLTSAVVFVGAVFAFMALDRHFHLSARPLDTMFSSGMVTLAILYVLISSAARLPTLFLMALPIPARDVFVARLLPALSIAWAPPLAIGGAAYLAGGNPPFSYFLSLIATGAVATVTILIVLPLRLREMSTRLGPVAAGLFLTYVSTCLVFLAPPGIVLAFCAVAIAALLWWDLASMPKAFQVAPADAVGERPSRGAHGSPRPVWWPVLRSMFGWRTRLILICSAWWLLCPLLSVTASLILALFVLVLGSSTCWLWALPMTRRKVLALGLLPPLLLEAVLQAIKPAGSVQALELVVLALLFTSAFLALYDWARLRPGAKFLAATGSILCLCGPLAMLIADFYHLDVVRKHFWGSYTAEYLTAQLSRIPPEPRLILIAGTLIALGALYWLVQRQFEAADFVLGRQTRRNG
jgi:hypothetical protein